IYTYNDAGSVLTREDALHQVVTMTYDALQRVKTKTYPNGDKYSWNYDETGHGAGTGRTTSRSLRRSGAGSDESSESMTYDYAGRVTSQTLCRGTGTCYTLGSGFDKVGSGRLTSIVYPDETVTYTYDGNGDLSTIPGYLQSLTLNARGEPAQMKYDT